MKKKTFKNLKVGDSITFRTWSEVARLNGKLDSSGSFFLFDFKNGKEPIGTCSKGTLDLVGGRTAVIKYVNASKKYVHVEIDEEILYSIIRQELREPDEK